MTRLALLPILTLALLAAAVPAVAATTYAFDVPEAFADRIERAKARDSVPILLPARLRSEHRRLHTSGTANRDRYAFSLASARRCGGATACFVAEFSGDDGARPSGRRVRLRGGRTGYFTPTRCGASCAVPQIQWRRGGVRYTIQARVGTARTERDRLVALANSALAAGPR